MNSDNILALALAALIGLLTLVVPPWSGLWWLGVISALLAAGWALIDIPLRRFEIEVDRYTRLTALAVVAMVFVASVAMWGFWPSWNDDSKVANFHIVATDVAWNSQNQNQLIANIYFQNDAGDADVSTYSATAFSPNAENKALIDQLRKNVTQIQHENKALHFNVKSK
jgi:hypothetical protein